MKERRNLLVYVLTFVIIAGSWLVLLPFALLGGEIGMVGWLTLFVVLIAVLMISADELLNDEDTA